MGGNDEHFLNQKIRVEFGDGRVEEYQLPDGEDYQEDLADWMNQIYTESLQYSAKISWHYESRHMKVLYDGATAKKWAQNIESSFKSDIAKLNAIEAKKNGWQPALDWARENGANIRKGKISKWLARVRIDEAGLRDEWNQRYPDYKFSEKDVDYAKSILEGRAEYYSKFKKKKR